MIQRLIKHSKILQGIAALWSQREHTKELSTFQVELGNRASHGSFQSESELVSTSLERPFRLLHQARTTSRQNVVRRKTQGKQGQKGCSVHGHGRRSVFLLLKWSTTYFTSSFPCVLLFV